MKMLLPCVCLLLGLLSLQGQGTVYFTANLTGNILQSGSRSFSLRTNDLFIYNVTTPYGFTQAQIRSPWPDTNAPVLFNLQVLGCVPPEPAPGTNAGFCSFQGSIGISDSERS